MAAPTEDLISATLLEHSMEQYGEISILLLEIEDPQSAQ
jgi:hypothetical protein